MTSDETLRIVLIFLGGLLAIPLIMMTLAVPMMGGHMWNGGMWDQPESVSAWVLVWGAILLILLMGGYLLLKGSRNEAGQSDQAIEELRIAYAKGELTDEEFESRQERLRSQE